MFNVYTFVLDDALKPAAPLIAPLVSDVASLTASSYAEHSGMYSLYLGYFCACTA